jgi:hypothetical protein
MQSNPSEEIPPSANDADRARVEARRNLLKGGAAGLAAAAALAMHSQSGAAKPSAQPTPIRAGGPVKAGWLGMLEPRS